MFYVPNNLKNENYTYYISDNNNVIIITNENCYNQFGTNYCDCINLYPNLDYVYSNKYTCSASNYNYSIPYNNITSDYWYRLNIAQILIIFTIIVLFSTFFDYKLFQVFRKRSR